MFIATATAIRSIGHGLHTYCSAKVNSALHPCRVAKSSTSLADAKARMHTSSGWQVRVRDPMVIAREFL